MALKIVLNCSWTPPPDKGNAEIEKGMEVTEIEKGMEVTEIEKGMELTEIKIEQYCK